MGEQVNSGLTTATISGSVTSVAAFNAPSASQTVTTKSTARAGQSITSGTGYTLHTVTGGKTFYMTSFVWTSISSGTFWELKDSSGGSVKLVGNNNSTNNVTNVYTFPTPIAFTTSVFVDVATTSTNSVMCNGWEQ